MGENIDLQGASPPACGKMFRRNSEEYCGKQANNKSISAVPHSVRSFLSFQNFQVEREPSDECLVLINGCECYKSQKVDTKYKRGDFNLKGVGWPLGEGRGG